LTPYPVASCVNHVPEDLALEPFQGDCTLAVPLSALVRDVEHALGISSSDVVELLNRQSLWHR
jgi:hypothetical protein